MVYGLVKHEDFVQIVYIWKKNGVGTTLQQNVDIPFDRIYEVMLKYKSIKKGCRNLQFIDGHASKPLYVLISYLNPRFYFSQDMYDCEKRKNLLSFIGRKLI